MTIAELIERLGDNTTQTTALHALIQLGPRAVPSLLKALQQGSENPQQRENAALALATLLGDSSFTPTDDLQLLNIAAALMIALNDPNSTVGLFAGRGLRHYAQSGPVEVLVYLLENTNTRGMAAEILRDRAREQPTPALRRALPVLRRYGRTVSFLAGTDPFAAHLCREAMFTIEQATKKWRDLPLPAENRAAPAEELPRPAMSSQNTPPENLPRSADAAPEATQPSAAGRRFLRRCRLFRRG